MAKNKKIYSRSGVSSNSKIPDATPAEKKQTRFIFTCIGGILYIVPCASCLGLGIATEGLTTPFILALVTAFLALPVSLIAMNRFGAKKGRGIVIAADAALIALHLVCALFIGTWYLIMAPEFILLALNIAWSDVITNH